MREATFRLRSAHLFGSLRISLMAENYFVGFGSTECRLERPYGLLEVPRQRGKDAMATILWIILIGFFAGIIARLLSPGPYHPTRFLFTTLLGVAGAFLAPSLCPVI